MHVCSQKSGSLEFSAARTTSHYRRLRGVGRIFIHGGSQVIFKKHNRPSPQKKFLKLSFQFPTMEKYLALSIGLLIEPFHVWINR